MEQRGTSPVERVTAKELLTWVVGERNSHFVDGVLGVLREGFGEGCIGKKWWWRWKEKDDRLEGAVLGWLERQRDGEARPAISSAAMPCR